MATTRDDIKRWIEQGLALEGVTHMIVVCDTFEYEDYPVYVTEDQIPQEVYEEYHAQNMQKVMEIYDLRADLEEQINAARAWSI
jgi:hypothetical protein